MIETLIERGEVGGRTVQATQSGSVECVDHPVPRPTEGKVLVRTVRSAISAGTELTLVGSQASNVYLRKTWDPLLRIFRPGRATLRYPLAFGYRASGEVAESRVGGLPPGTPVWGNWRHTEYTLRDASALDCRLPDSLTHDDGVDLAQMGPICLNAVAFADDELADGSAVVFGAGVIGLITAQLARVAGARSVHIVDRLPTRLAAAAALGFATVQTAPDVDVAYELKTSLGPDSIALAFECTGSTSALHEAIRSVRRRGLVVAVGFYQGAARGLYLGDEFHHNGIRLVCSQIGNVHPEWDVARLRRRVLELALSGQLVLDGLPRLSLPVERVADGFEALRHPEEVLQVVLAYD